MNGVNQLLLAASITMYKAVTMTNWVSEAVLGCSKSIVWVETTDLVGQQTMRSDRIIDFLFFKYSNHV